MYLKRIQDKKVVPQLKDLTPSTAFLFGGSVKGLAEDIVASHQLDPFAGYSGGGSKRGKRGGYNQGRGGGAGGSFSRQVGKNRSTSLPPARGRGGKRGGDRLSKFKED